MMRLLLGFATLTLAGCFDFDALRKPLDGGASGDMTGGGATPTPRLIAQAWFSDASGTTHASTAGMLKSQFEIPTAGIVDGDVVLFIGSIDNGSNTVWPNPIAPGFTQLAQSYFGSDGQTFVVAYKVASSEPAKYTGIYGSGIGSGSSAITLIAVSGANRVMPINNSLDAFSSMPGMSPVNGSADGFSTTAANCTLVLAGGVDWLGQGGSNTFTLPSGFTSLSQLGDNGGTGAVVWDWTSQQVSWRPQAQAGATGAVNWSATGSFAGQAWTAIVAVAP
jgi:hypothetical protein